jgi:hypothetical protein
MVERDTADEVETKVSKIAVVKKILDDRRNVGDNLAGGGWVNDDGDSGTPWVLPLRFQQQEILRCIGNGMQHRQPQQCSKAIGPPL